MKRIICCLFAILMSIFCFSACDKENNNAQESSTPTASSSDTSSADKQENSIEFKYSELTLTIGESVQAEIVTSKSNVFVFWSVLDKSIATVSSKGVITAVAEGQTICYAEFGGKSAMCLIKVKPQGAAPMLSISVPYADNKVVLYKGDSIDLKVSAKLGDDSLENAQTEFVVADTQLASVANGVLEATAVGSTTVEITVTHEGQEATLTLTVEIVEKAA